MTPLVAPGFEESARGFRFSEPIRAAILLAASKEPLHPQRTMEAIALSDRMSREGDYAQAARVALRGHRWRMASWCLRAALCQGALGLDEIVSLSGGRELTLGARKDPFLALLLGFSPGPVAMGISRARVLSEALAMLDRCSPDDWAGSAPRDPRQARIEQVWTSLARLLIHRSVGDWRAAHDDVRRSENAVAALTHTDFSDALPLIAESVVETEVTRALLGEPSQWRTSDVLDMLRDSTSKDRGRLVSSLALLSAIRGEHLMAAELLEELPSTAGDAVSRSAVLASALLAADRGDQDALARAMQQPTQQPLLAPYLDDLQEYLSAQLAVLREQDGVRMQILARIVPRRAAPWILDEVGGLLAERRLALPPGRHTTQDAPDPFAGANPRAAAMRLALAKERFATSRFDSTLQIAGGIWAGEGTSPLHRARAYAIGLAAADALDDEPLAMKIAGELGWLLQAHDLCMPLDDLPPGVALRWLPDSGRRAPGLRPAFPRSVARVELSERELAVIKLLADEPSAQAIAEHLHVSLNTVKTQLRHAYRKLGVHSRAEALRAAIDLGLILPG